MADSSEVDAEDAARAVSRAAEKAERERRRRAAELLGDVLPSTTRDDTDEGWSEVSRGSRDDDLRRDVPPHHGGN